MHHLLRNLLSQNTLFLAIQEAAGNEFLEKLKEMNNPLLQSEQGRNDAFLTAIAEVFGEYREGTYLYNVSGDAAIIPIHGMLINRFNSFWGFITGYNYIKAAITEALKDDTIKSIILDINSNGGEVAGCFETVDFIKEAREIKPITALVDSRCYSAAYALATAANKIIATPSAGIGSIGVVAMHFSQEKMMSDWGINVTFLIGGEKKVLGNPYKDLTDEDKAELQKTIDKSYENFVSLVSDNRSLDKQVVKDTQAACFAADEALALGLIDEIEHVERALGRLTEKEKSMDKEAERLRIKTILGQAHGNINLAEHLAFNTDLDAEAAIAMLNAAKADDEEKEKEQEKKRKADEEKRKKEKEQDEADEETAKAKAPSTLEQAMALTGAPNIGADNKGMAEAAEFDAIVNFANNAV